MENLAHLSCVQDLQSKTLSYRCLQGAVMINREVLQALKAQLGSDGGKTVRICLHAEGNNPLHEMIIIHAQGGVFPTHLHLQTPESYHIFEGILIIDFFDDQGQLQERIRLGDLQSGLPFFYRVPLGIWHRTYPETSMVLYKESRPGPFIAADTLFPTWE